MNITFLGTGTSHGVPTIDCLRDNRVRCKKNVCRLCETDPLHRRTRASIYIKHHDKGLLIDVSADFRQQILREQITTISAVLVTHPHADHISGLPDIRSFTRPHEPKLVLYGSTATLASIKQAYNYIFDPNTFVGGGIPLLEVQPVGPYEKFSINGFEITPIPVEHGNLEGCYGYRINTIGYIPDMKNIDNQAKSCLKNLDVLILNCLRDEREHATHLILPQSMALARELAPKRCFFTHMCHDIHYAIDGKLLDSWMEFAWDGLSVEV